MASTSSTGSKIKNDDTRAFDGIAPSASTSASKLIRKPSYDVFINHRGPDVKSTLASVLYGILTGMALSVFLDSHEMEYGDFLPQTIEAAMTSALVHIAIFSKRYAESPWCLAELSFMLKSGATIIPIFYHVGPTDLRYIDQGKGIYVDSFKEHERKGRYSLEQLQEWKEALKKVSFYNGQIVKTDEDETRLLKNIVNCVLKEKNNVPLVVAKHPVGLKEIVQDFEMNTLQSVRGIQIVGIWGMGGSGKTTLAKELYNKRSSSIERSSFIFDVRDGAAKGLLQVKQNKLLNDLGVKNVIIDHTEEGKALLTRHLRSVSVLIVLDDVDHADQLDALLPAIDSLGRDSLIIVTTREREVLTTWGISFIYKMRPLDPFHAEQLFCWHAFLQSFPPDGFEELVKRVLDACHRLPLSLKVFGGQLYGKSSEYWKSLLHKISRILPSDIKNILKVSYDALDYEEKEMFLDTACFFIGEERSLAIEVWNGSGWSGLHGWERLLNKCLVELDDDNLIRMHDHIRDLGWEIANLHSPSRLWLREHEKQIEKRNDIRGIKPLNVWSRMKPHGSCRPYGEELGVEISGGSLVGLKLFVIRGDFNQVICQVSRELIWLRWFEIERTNLPARLSLKTLRVLQLYESQVLEELWEAESDPPLQLRDLVIYDCPRFRRFPNSIGCLSELKKIVITKGNNLSSLPEEFYRLQSLEHLQLCDCEMLSSLPEEFCRLQSLEHLQLRGCVKLSSLPSRFGDLRNLRFLDLSRCGRLQRLPVSFKNLVLLQYLHLEDCEDLRFTSEDFQNIRKLEFLRLPWCEQSGELPRHITNQASLRELYLYGDRRINIAEGRSRLQNISIGSALLTSLPNSLGDLSSLTKLSIECCYFLESLPTSLGDLCSLTSLSIFLCPALKCSLSVGRLNLLEDLKIDQCPISHVDFGAASLPFALSNLKRIDLRKAEVCRISIPEDRYSRLESLYLYSTHHLREIGTLPTTVKSIILTSCEMLKIIRGDLVNLERLHIWSCPEVDELPSFARSTSLRDFELNGCYRIQKIEGLEYCTRLERLHIRSCPEVDELPSFALLTSLRDFELTGCYRIQKIDGLEYCTRLETLTVHTCWEMPGIKSLEHTKKLRKVVLKVNKGSAIERCIQTIQDWPDEIIICTQAIPDASSVVDSLLSLNLDDPSSNGDATMLCLVIICVSSQLYLIIHRNGPEGTRFLWLDKGRWVLAGVFTQGGHIEVKVSGDGEMEKGLVVRGEKQRLVEAFQGLLPLLQR